MSDRRGYQGGIVWPLVLIAAGAILLLNNLGITDINLWQVALRLWPALLIGFGVELLIPRRSIWGSLAAFITVIAVLAASYWLLTVNQLQPGSVSEFEYPLENATRAEVFIDQAVGELTITTGSDSETLVAGSIQSVERFQPTIDFAHEGTAARLELAESSRQYGPLPVFTGSPHWTLQLTGEIPMNLNLHQGVGLARLSLRRANLGTVVSDFGVGRMVVELPSNQISEVFIDGGIGEVLLVLPAGVAYEIELDRGLSTLQYPPSYQREGSLLRSVSAGTIEQPVKISIDLGVGSIRIVEE